MFLSKLHLCVFTARKGGNIYYPMNDSVPAVSRQNGPSICTVTRNVCHNCHCLMLPHVIEGAPDASSVDTPRILVSCPHAPLILPAGSLALSFVIVLLAFVFVSCCMIFSATKRKATTRFELIKCYEIDVCCLHILIQTSPLIVTPSGREKSVTVRGDSL